MFKRTRILSLGLAMGPLYGPDGPGRNTDHTTGCQQSGGQGVQIVPESQSGAGSPGPEPARPPGGNQSIQSAPQVPRREI